MAAEVAERLDLPFDVLVVRKIGHPVSREFALGALAEDDVIILDPQATRYGDVEDVERVILEEQENLRIYQSLFGHPGKHSLASQDVLLVDDGIATGATTEAAVRSAFKQGARFVTVTAPVASAHAVDRLRRIANAVEIMLSDPEFQAVGRYYLAFPQTTDEEVLNLLSTNRSRLPQHERHN